MSVPYRLIMIFNKGALDLFDGILSNGLSRFSSVVHKFFSGFGIFGYVGSCIVLVSNEILIEVTSFCRWIRAIFVFEINCAWNTRRNRVAT